METSEIVERKFIIRLEHKGTEIERIEKTFGLVENDSNENQVPTSTIDETVSEVLKKILEIANNHGFEIDKQELTEVMMTLIFSLIKSSEPVEITVSLYRPKTEPEVKEDGESNT